MLETNSDLKESCQKDQIKLNEYTIGKELGKGGFGTTYMATKSNDSRSFVLKKIQIKTPNQLIAIHSEINILQKIAGPGCTTDILCYHDHFIDCSDPDFINIVIVTLAFEDAVTLENFIQKNLSSSDEDEDEGENVKTIKQLQPDVLLTIMFNILKPLVHLQKLCIGHADIKPENILINPKTYNVQIIDFGIACTDSFCSESENKCNISGTLLYSSPEILETRLKKINMISVNDMQQSDVFSLGIVFYRLANGTFPFPMNLQRGLNLYRAVNNLLPYYEKTKIESYYNQNKTQLDQKINEFITSMLTVSSKQRPKFSNLLQQIQNLLNEL